MRSAVDMHTPRLLHEWSEEDGDVLWWRFPIVEPPYVGSPLDIGFSIEVVVDGERFTKTVGGWPGDHTHWTPLPDAKVLQRNTE